MNRLGFFELLSRLPPRIWLQAALGLVALLVIAVLGFAIIAGFVAVAITILLAYRLRAWVTTMFAGRQPMPPARTDRPNVTDVTYEIVDRSDGRH